MAAEKRGSRPRVHDARAGGLRALRSSAPEPDASSDGYLRNRRHERLHADKDENTLGVILSDRRERRISRLRPGRFSSARSFASLRTSSGHALVAPLLQNDTSYVIYGTA